MSDPTGSASTLVPGFEFMQSLVKSAGSALPGIGQWVAPTIDPDEIAKRIEELRTVQFWLEQNVRMIGATIQAMEVQRMTLSTLKTMNVRMEDLRESMKIKPPATPAFGIPAPATAATTGSGSANAVPPAGVVDPMQWWGALTRQFTELATSAMKESGVGAAAAPDAAAPATFAGDQATGDVAAKSKFAAKPAAAARKPAGER